METKPYPNCEHVIYRRAVNGKILTVTQENSGFAVWVKCDCCDETNFVAFSGTREGALELAIEELKPALAAVVDGHVIGESPEVLQ